MTISKAHVATKYLLMPEPQTVILYRLNPSTNAIAAQQTVEYAERRGTVNRESIGMDGPTKIRETTFHLWSIPLNGWVPAEYDRLCHVKEGNVREYFMIRDVNLELLDVRYRVSCVPSGDPTS